MTPAPKTRSGALTIAISALVSLTALTFAPAAFAAGDPVASGTLRVEPGDAFKRQLSRNHVHLHLNAGSFAIASGSIDPTTGAGSLRLRGSMIFKHGKERLRFRKLAATLGPSGGSLKSGHTRLLGLGAGSVSRNGFGAEVEGIDLRLPRTFARKLRKAFDLRSLRPGAAGSAAVSEQPETVQIVSGTADVTPASGAGSIASKLAAHCVDLSTGITPIAPGTQPGGPGTTLFYPVAFGTISPLGAAGVIQQTGGVQIANGGSGLPSGCPTSNTLTMGIKDFSIDLQSREATAHVSIRGSGSPFGDLDAQISFPINVSGAFIWADPTALAIATRGSAIDLNALAATMLNTVLPQPSPADPSLEFAAGDRFGGASLTVQVR